MVAEAPDELTFKRMIVAITLSLVSRVPGKHKLMELSMCSVVEVGYRARNQVTSEGKHWQIFFSTEGAQMFSFPVHSVEAGC